MAVLLVAHGFGEHSGRYENVVSHFVPLGYAVYALDHRGHGRSDGGRVAVLDPSGKEIGAIALPHPDVVAVHHDRRDVAVAEAGDGGAAAGPSSPR